MKSPYLGKGVLGVLKDFGRVGIGEISESIGWKRKNVYDELRRIKNMSILGKWIVRTEEKNEVFYELDPIMRNGASIDCLNELAKETFKFKNSNKIKNND
jgi:hypothetical protein